MVIINQTHMRQERESNPCRLGEKRACQPLRLPDNLCKSVAVVVIQSLFTGQCAPLHGVIMDGPAPGTI
ncbi:hypothetical protein DPMN_142651 [Dreissena polymorpha]|uniref:Uncharacterized protein n=1 Tax=Dreissena polymorpha TaxID=45954 RepID=A0A9D4JMD9_DREPO|nr:hypothetical protein DPMN_142651 [Dreissena polymorpha]